MRLTITTQPDLLVSLAEVKVALGESGTDRDTLIGTYLLAAQAEIDGPKGWVGVTIAEQSVEATLDRLGDINLPAGPVDPVSVVITYLDAEGNEQTLATTVYTADAAGRVRLKASQSWPSTYSQAGAVTVAWDAGISDATDPRIALMKTAIIMHVKMTLDHTEPEKRRETIGWLLSPLKAWSV